MRSLVALVLAVSFGCASSEYRPRARGIATATYNGAPRWFKNGEPITTSLQAAMSDVPAAAAYEKKSRKSATIGWTLFGVAIGLVIAAVVVSAADDHPDHSNGPHEGDSSAAIASGLLLIGSVATDIVAATFLSKSLAQRSDALNLYNDTVDARSQPIESFPEPTPSAPELPSPELPPSAPEPADVNSL